MLLNAGLVAEKCGPETLNLERVARLQYVARMQRSAIRGSI